MDGILDEDAELVLSAGGLELWLDSQDGFCYLASTPAEIATDNFVFISKELNTLVSAPWEKAGLVGNWDLYLANEGMNGYNAWYDQEGSAFSAFGYVLEGYFNIEAELGNVDSFFVALGKYKTLDGGTLLDQLPLGNSDLNIDLDEYYLYNLNDLSAPQNLSISVNENNITLNWLPVANASLYKVYESNDPDSNFVEIDVTANTIYIISNAGDSKKFFRVTAIR